MSIENILQRAGALTTQILFHNDHGQDDGHDNDDGSENGTGVSSSSSNKTTASISTLANYLVDGYWSERAFDVSAGGTLTVRFNGLPAESQQLARWALDIWSEATGITFVVVTNRIPDILLDDRDSSGAYSTQSMNADGDITYAYVNIPQWWVDTYGSTIDSYSLQTFVHEIGHALGLGHAGPYNGSGNFETDAVFANDSWQLSVMSYFSQTDNPNVRAAEAFAITPMIADILAVEMLYGGTSDANAGDTIYGVGGTTVGVLGELMGILYDGDYADPDIYSGENVTYTVNDDTGIDTFDFSSDDSNQILNLVPGGISTTFGVRGNLILSRGTFIENAITGSGDDTIIGNIVDNQLSSGDGNDLIDGRDGSDTIEGEEGTDVLFGGDGADTFVFESGDGVDIVADFESGEDTLEFSGVASVDDLEIVDFRFGATIQNGTDWTFLFGVDADSMGADDFSFV